MYAVFRDGGKQYKVMEGQELLVDHRRIALGQRIEFDEVVSLNDNDGTRFGTPVLPGAKVVAEVLAEEKGDKIVVQHFRRRKKIRRVIGHRQKYIRVRVKEIVAPPGDAGDQTSADNPVHG